MQVVNTTIKKTTKFLKFSEKAPKNRFLSEKQRKEGKVSVELCFKIKNDFPTSISGMLFEKVC